VNGRFSMWLAHRGRMVLTVAAPGRPLAESFIQLVGPPIDVDIETARRSRLVMRTMSMDDRPVAGTLVAFSRNRGPAATDDTGRLVVNGIGGGRHTIAVKADGYAPRSVEVVADRETLIRLQAVPHVKVEVSASPALVSSLGDRPLVEVSLVAPGDRPEWEAGSEPRSAIAELAPDGSGRAVIEKVPPGAYRSWVTWRGGLVRGPIVRVNDETPVAVHIRLTGEASLAGSIRERVDGRLRDVRWYPDLWVIDERQTVGAPALVENGRYSFTLLPPGRWRLETHRSRRIEIRPGANRRDLVVPYDPER